MEEEVAKSNGSIGEENKVAHDINGGGSEDDTIDNLHAEIAKLKLQLEEQHDSSQENGVNGDSSEITSLKEQLKQAEEERDQNKESYDQLLSRLSSMKSFFAKMKESQGELEETKEELEKVKESKDELASKMGDLEKVNEELNAKLKEFTQDNESLNSECDRLSNDLAVLRRELHTKEDTLQDEKYALENSNSKLMKRLSELKNEYNDFQIASDEARIENKTLTLKIEELTENMTSKDATIEDLNSKIAYIKEEITNKQSEVQNLNKKLEEQVSESGKQLEISKEAQEKLNTTLHEKQSQIDELQKQVGKVDELKTDINNKQLLIGKLRHEAIILNEHLTKALTMLKQQLSNSDNTVDRELISNIIINFLQIPRGDSKKFEALQLLSALLEWDDSKKIAAGLSHDRLKISADGTVRQSFVSLWTDFLEKESSGK